MNDENKLNKIKKLLDFSASRIKPHTLEQLRMARSRALDQQRTRRTSPVLAWVDSHTGRHHHLPVFSKSTNWAIAVIFVACLISGIGYWQTYTKEHETDDIDIAILTDDLPIHVYLD
jgi:hypothetical protein